MIEDLTTPQTCRYITLWNVHVKNWSNHLISKWSDYYWSDYKLIFFEGGSSMLHILNHMVYTLHLLQLTTFWLINTTVNIQNVFSDSNADMDTSAPLVMQWHRELRSVPLHPTHQSDDRWSIIRRFRRSFTSCILLQLTRCWIMPQM